VAGRWVPTPVTPRYVAQRPPVLPWLTAVAGLLAVLVLVGASALVIPMVLALAGAGFAAWRWWSAMAVAARRNDEVRSSPGRHARVDGAVDLSALVPGQRSESPVLPPSTMATGAARTAGANAEPISVERSGGEGRHRSPRP
jgi:hypothetical protein